MTFNIQVKHKWVAGLNVTLSAQKGVARAIVRGGGRQDAGSLGSAGFCPPFIIYRNICSQINRG